MEEFNWVEALIGAAVVAVPVLLLLLKNFVTKTANPYDDKVFAAIEEYFKGKEEPKE
jgi:hypothetical protein